MNIADRAFIYRAGKLLIFLVLSFLSLFLILLVCCSSLISGLFMIIVSVILLVVFLPIRLSDRSFTITRVILGIAAVLMMFLFSDLPIREIHHRFNTLDDKVTASGPKALNFWDKMTVYNTNMIIGTYGHILGVPEYGKQSLRLILKTRKPRKWESDFALKSPKVVGVINNWIVLLKRQRRDKSFIKLPPRRISWQSARNDRRVALALNPAKMEAKATPIGDRWQLDIKATTRMKFRQNAKRIILTAGNTNLVLPEKPFWALQQLGWLKPYTVIWEWFVFSDDERLNK